MSEKELSPLARQLLGGSGHVKFFTQKEFDESLALAQAEIMHVAVETTKRAIMIEREACADLVRDIAKKEGSEYAVVLESISEAILNRIPSQRQ